MLQLEEEGSCLHGGGGADNDPFLHDTLTDIFQTGVLAKALVHQPMAVARVARGF